MKTPEPTKLDPDYYPRIKINRRWYMIVPEKSHGNHDGCAFYRPEMDTNRHDDWSHCKLMVACAGNEYNSPVFERHDCGDRGTIFVAPAKFPEYRAHLVAEKLEGKS
jgi:hypothetical protein